MDEGWGRKLALWAGALALGAGTIAYAMFDDLVRNRAVIANEVREGVSVGWSRVGRGLSDDVDTAVGTMRPTAGGANVGTRAPSLSEEIDAAARRYWDKEVPKTPRDCSLAKLMGIVEDDGEPSFAESVWAHYAEATGADPQLASDAEALKARIVEGYHQACISRFGN